MFTNPEAYNVLPFYNNYTEDEQWVKTAYFIPADIAFYRDGYVDERGVCDLKKARHFYELEREKLVQSPKALIDYRAEYCFYPSEAFALEGDNIFNKVKLTEQITNIKFKLVDIPHIEIGKMQFTYSGSVKKRENINGVIFKPDPKGHIAIILHPIWDSSYLSLGLEEDEEEIKEKMADLYVAGIDGIDIGLQDTSDYTKNPSKFCTAIKRRVHGMKAPVYVAFYLDRPERIEEAYELTLGLLYYYNARANLEASKVGILTWAKKEKWILYFMRRPRVCQGDPTKKRSSTVPYGTTTSTAMIEHGLLLVASYIEDYSNEIWFPELLELLLKYSLENKGKFDMVAAMQMTEIADEEISDFKPHVVKKIASQFKDIGYYIDENGYRHFGVIPQLPHIDVNVTWDLSDQQNKTSDPRYK